MKFRITALFLALVAVFSLSSCNNGKEADPSSSSLQEESSSQVNTESDISSDSASKDESSSTPSSSKPSASSSKPSGDIGDDDIDINITYTNAPKVKLASRTIDIKNNEPIAAQVKQMGYYIEMPPYLQMVNGKVKAFLATSWTGMAEFNSGKTLKSTSNVFNTSSKKTMSSSSIVNFGQQTWKPETIANEPYWMRNYYGIFNTLTVKPAGKEEHLLAIMHCENKNERFDLGTGPVYYNNTVFPLDKVYSQDEYDGAGPDGVYKESSGTYFAFTSMAVLPSKDVGTKTFNDGDLGPVIWPSAGYLNSKGEQASQGLRHPTGFSDGEYVYIYYLDTSKTNSEAGRQAGLKVARSPISELGKPGSFKTYFSGKWEEDALPKNFDKNSRDMFYKKGGKSSIIINDQIVRFSVAKVKGTPYYLGVEEAWTSQGLSIMLRASRDLVTWGDPLTIYNVQSGKHTDGYLHYPVFYNKNFTSCVEIDKDEFYIGGTFGPGTPTTYFQYVKLSVDISDN
ncbi:MAG: hypothetical protein E7480_02610 [Ruminococcaceae bacterium]|nr:hypothetical protein [Oscillospiraceae bacterium]